MVSTFIHEAKYILERKEMFNLTNLGKNNSIPSFTVAFKMNTAVMRPIQEHLKLKYRVVTIPDIPISVYLNTFCQLVFSEYEKDFPSKV